ncbi:MAG: hypothetical protein WKG07_00260 [Hymenobacter sp.]
MIPTERPAAGAASRSLFHCAYSWLSLPSTSRLRTRPFAGFFSDPHGLVSWAAGCCWRRWWVGWPAPPRRAFWWAWNG